MNYIGKNFNEARAAKWENGIQEYRNGDSAAPFRGEPCEEAFQECLDLFNLLIEVESATGADTRFLREQTEHIALSIQRIFRAYPRKPIPENTR